MFFGVIVQTYFKRKAFQAWNPKPNIYNQLHQATSALTQDRQPQGKYASKKEYMKCMHMMFMICAGAKERSHTCVPT